MFSSQNNKEAIDNYSLGCRYKIGQGVEKDQILAAKHFKLAADNGHQEAQFNLGIIYETGQGIEQDETLAAKYYKLAADQGHIEAQYNMGVIYETGQGVEEDETLAAKYYKLAADQGHTEAQYNIAVIYEAGQGVDEDETLAAQYYRLAADQGHPEAQYNLAVMYETGQGIVKDAAQAIKYYKLAANQKHKESQHRLDAIAETYETGLGIEEDEELILEYYKLTAEQGSIEAALRLSIIYKIGWGGIKQNIELSNHFHRLATMVGDQDEFRQFITSTKQSNKLLEAPSLLVRTFEKRTTGVLEQGLYKYIFSPGVELSKSYIPWDPPLAELQRGPTCGLNALKKGLDWGCQRNTPPVRKNPIKPTKLEKEKNQNIISLRKAAKECGSVTGEIFDIDWLEKIAKKFEFTCNTIKLKEEDRISYIKKILDAIQEGNSVILPVDNDNGFPGDKQGKETHYALAWGYIYKDEQYHFLVTHWGKHYLWSADALQKSHEQLPDINPRYGKYYKDHKKDDYYYCEENVKYPEKDIRVMPPSNLRNFKFTALVIPATAENCLSLDNEKVASQYVNTTVNNADAITLKVLAETGGIFKSALKMEDDTEENKKAPFEIKSCVKESIV